MSTDISLDDLHRQSNQLESIAALALDEAKALGATATEVVGSRDAGLSVGARKGSVETVEHHSDKSLSITVYFGHKKASAGTSDHSETAIRDCVKAACNIANFTEEDDCAGLADANLMATTIPDLDLYHPWDIEAEQLIELAIETEAAALKFDKRISNSEGANVGKYQGLSLYANSHGFCGSRHSTKHSISCSVIAGQGKEMQREFWYSSVRRAEDLESGASVGAQSARRAISRLGAKPIKTGSYPVVFSAEMSKGLIGHFVSAISGGAQYRRNTFLLDQLGETVFSSQIQIVEQPLIPRAMGSSPFDSDGLARFEKSLVVDGVLQTYILSTYSARKLGLQSTANAGGVRNLTLQPGVLTEAQLLQEMGSGFFITELMGQGVSMASGDYSRGAAGFWVENGEVQHAVQEVTVAGNLKDVFKQIVAVGSEVDLRGNYRCPALLVSEMTVSGS